MPRLTGTDNAPPRTQVYLTADYVELRCAISEDGAFSAEEFQDARKRQDNDDVTVEETGERELLLGPDVAVDLSPAEEAVLGLADAVLSEAEGKPPADAGVDSNADAGAAADDDAREVEASDVLNHLRYRAEVFGDAYPFVLRDDAVLELRDLTDQRWLYLALLLSANLTYVRGKPDENKLTTYFELIAPDVMRGYLGDGARVELFGTTTDDADQTHYAGSLFEKVSKLKNDLRLPLLVGAGDPVIAQNNQGDNGVDLVAWFPVSDPASTMVTILGQCACGRRPWPKMLEPSEENWNRIFAFTSPVVNVLLVPQCFRTSDGKWYSEAKLKKGVLLDRVRIMEFLGKSAVALPIAPAKYPSELLQEVFNQAA